MLGLNDDRWCQLTTFFGDPETIPIVLERWMASIGFDQERTIYSQELFDFFLHQATITNAAFAIVPYLVDVCKTKPTRYQVNYLTDVVQVEANRLRHGVYFNRSGTEESPEWLMSDYRQSILECRNLVDDVLDEEHNVGRKSMLAALKPALYGNADLPPSQWTSD